MMLLHRHMLAAVLGALLLAALLVLSSLTVVRAPPVKKLTVLQNVQIYVPQPPPSTPEPVKRSNRGGAAGALQVQIPQQQVQLGLMQLDTSFASPRGVPVVAGTGNGNLFGAGTGTGGDGFGGDELIMQMSQLDSTPMVVSAPLFIFPEQLQRKQIKEFTVQFQIYVDTDGHTYPVRVVDSPDRSLDAQFLDYAAHVIFTPPVRAGKPVRAQYLWPVRFADTAPPNGAINRIRNGIR